MPEQRDDYRTRCSFHPFYQSTPLLFTLWCWADAGREEEGERLCASGDARSEENLKER